MKKYILFVCEIFLILGCSSTKNSIENNFYKPEIELITNADSLTPMRVYKITNKQDSLLLRKRSQHITPNINNPILQKFIKRLYTTVRDSSSMGVGIAAPQVGILKNIIWVQCFDKENFPFEVYLNPKIINYSEDKQTFKEGCLSIPKRSDTLNSRSENITIEYDTNMGAHKTENIKGFTSVIFQHEIDHLNGILYLDHLKKDVTNSK